MSSTENPPTETDLSEEFNSQAETDQEDVVNEAQERADSVADGYDEQFNAAAEGQETQADSQEYSTDAQERADSVADGANNESDGSEVTISSAHENVSRTELTNASELNQEFNEAAADDMEEAGDYEDGDGDDGDDDPPGSPPELNYE